MRSLKGRDKPSIRMGEDHRSTCFISIRKGSELFTYTAYLLHMSSFKSVFLGTTISNVYIYHQRNPSYLEQSYFFNISVSSHVVTNPNYFLHQSKSRSNIATFTYLFYYCYKAYASTLVQPFFFFLSMFENHLSKTYTWGFGLPSECNENFSSKRYFPSNVFPICYNFQYIGIIDALLWPEMSYFCNPSWGDIFIII